MARSCRHAARLVFFFPPKRTSMARPTFKVCSFASNKPAKNFTPSPPTRPPAHLPTQKTELEPLLRALGMAVTDAELKVALASVDADGSGDVSFSEFYAWFDGSGGGGGDYDNGGLGDTMSDFDTRSQLSGPSTASAGRPSSVGASRGLRNAARATFVKVHQRGGRSRPPDLRLLKLSIQGWSCLVRRPHFQHAPEHLKSSLYGVDPDRVVHCALGRKSGLLPRAVRPWDDPSSGLETLCRLSSSFQWKDV